MAHLPLPPRSPFLALPLLAFGLVACGEDGAGARREIREAGSAVRKYLGKTLEQWQGELEEKEIEVDDLREKAKALGRELDETLEDSLAAAERGLKEVRQDLDELGEQAGEATRELRQGLQNAWREVESALERAREELKTAGSGKPPAD
jgi:septal ring factor EnvC (AmiA/AmiB activator)